MTSSQTATLSQTILTQKHGVVLVWGDYSNGENSNKNFNLYFVPKQFVRSHGGYGITCFGASGDGTNIMCKYVYVSNTKITGNDYNNAYDTTEKNSGIYRTNNRWVLRYVIGV